ncbi:MAG: hypothetical protein AMJ78_05170 [Omnitrophica WOR_2 bacterium SM23_29]|nr:MAG: hypothetical protein AMJ78_05170 [Omnitrophica WOR_2 bacterium SM23_29]
MRREDEKFMRFALELAKMGKGLTSPNPCVGAVIVKDGKVIGKGYHKGAGRPHAEIYALRQAGRKAHGATLYVSLEPCRHYGKTPPCTNAIISHKIKRVVTAMKDPNPLNDGKGIMLLRRNGVEVKVGVLEDEAKKMNEAFMKFITKKIPFVTVKVAQSLDGKIATHTGDSKWITNEVAREYVHRLRGKVDAILVGVKTVLIDDPLLTARPKDRKIGKQPIRIILDSKLRIPLNARIFSKALSGKVIIATTRLAPKNKLEALKKKNAEILIVGSRDGKVNIKSLMKELVKKDIAHVLVEGGGEAIASVIEAKVVDKVLFFIAPKIIGGRQATTSVEGAGVNRVNRAIELKEVGFESIGDNFLIEGYIKD